MEARQTAFHGKVDRNSQKYLESNFFLLTGILLTGLFDFNMFTVGLTRMSWRSLMGAASPRINLSLAPTTFPQSFTPARCKWNPALCR